MAQESIDDGETEKALTDYQEGMRLGDGVRAAEGMRRLQSLDSSNLELLVQMLRKDSHLSNFDLYFLKFDEPQQHVSDVSSVAFMVDKTLSTALALGSAEATANALVKLGKLEGDDLELLAKMIEDQEPFGLPPISFVQRRTGPPVDPLAVKARWFVIYNTYKRLPKLKATGKKKLEKELFADTMDALKGKIDVSRSLLYEIRDYFKHPKK